MTVSVSASSRVMVRLEYGDNAVPPGIEWPPRPPGGPPIDPPEGSPGLLETAAPLAIGDEGDEVTQLQETLNDAGSALALDGDFGPATQSAVRTFQARRILPVTGWVDGATGRALDRVDRLETLFRHATAPGCPWITEVRACTGVDEVPGSADSPIIMAWRSDIVHAYPEMASYTAGYTGDDVAWCGFGLAAAMCRAGIRPPYDPDDDTGSYMWALSWADWGTKVQPCVGAIWTSERDGGGHVAVIEKIEGSTVYIRGFNQSDTVNVTTKNLSDLVSARWPTGWPLVDVDSDISSIAPPGSEA